MKLSSHLLSSAILFMRSMGKTIFLLLVLLVLFSCTESSSSVTPISDAPAAATATLPSMNYDVSGDFYITLASTDTLIKQKTDFGNQANFYINPSLPNGLSLDITSGSIKGTPTTLSLPTRYTVTATPDNKNYTIRIITIGVAPSQVWVTNTNSAKPYELTAYVVGDLTKQTGLSWSSGDSSLATVDSKGVVDLKTSLTGGNVEVVATTTDGDTGRVTFSVAGASIDYGTSNFYIALANGNILLEQKTDFNGQAGFSVAPNLPNGFTLDATSGNIGGTSTVVMPPRNYTITATVAGKSQTKVVTLGVAPSQVWVTNIDSAKPYELTAYVVGDRTQQAGVNWSSSDDTLATVNNGVVDIKTSLVGGDVDIIATKDGNTGRFTFNVNGASIDYGTSDFYIAGVYTQVDLVQNFKFGSSVFSITPTLPNGLSIDTASGSISGVPTVVTLPREYTVTVMTGGRSQTKVVTLGVAPSQVWVTNIDLAKPYELTAYVVGDRTQQAGISWSSSDTSLATVNNNGVVDIKTSPAGGSVEIIATKGGGTGRVTFNVFSAYIDYGTSDFYIALVNTRVNLAQSSAFNNAIFSVTPTLPNGLSIDATSGNIGGTSTVVMPPRNYTITATVAGKSQTKVVTLGVAPSEVWVTNVNSAKPYELTAYVVGDRTKQIGVSWSSSDTSLATVNNGVVSPKTSPVGGDVVIFATKDGYTGRVTFTVASTLLPIDYDLNGNLYVFLANNYVLLQQKTDFGGHARFSISPNLPSGLFLNANKGDISGRPIALSLLTQYTVTATINGKAQTEVLSLGVAPSQVWVTNIDSAKPYELTAYVVGDGLKQAGVFWRSSDESLATVNNGVVSPKGSVIGGNVVITARRDGNTGSVTFNIARQTMDYGVGGFYRALNNTPINLVLSSVFSSTTFSITPALPNGLTLDTTSGSISGTFSQNHPLAEYTITAMSGGVSQTKKITLGSFFNKVWVVPNPTNSSSNRKNWKAYAVGGAAEQTGFTWSSSDTSLATVNNGVVSFETVLFGGPVTIYARKGGEEDSVLLTVPSGSIDYGASDYYIARVNNPINIVQNTRVSGITFSINPALPNGLTLDTTSGDIRGTFTTVMLPIEYTVTGRIPRRNYTTTKITLGAASRQVWVTNVDAANPYGLTAYVVGDRTKQAGISWSSSDTSLATVNNGMVSLKTSPRGGTVVVTARTTDGDTASVTFTFGKVVNFSDGQLTVNGGVTNLIINSGVTTIDAQFSSERFNDVFIPDSVTNIGLGAFGNNQLASVVIPNSVITIGEDAFYGNKLSTLVLHNGLRSIGDSAFGINQLTSVVFPDSLITIGHAAFWGNDLKSVVIPDSVRTIGDNAFKGNKLTNVVIGDSVTTIGDDAFISNPDLKVVSLKQSLYDSLGSRRSTVFGSQVTSYIRR